MKNILVLEDETPLLKVIVKKLSNSKYHVISARSVEEGLNHLRDVNKIDAIWLDHYLLGKDDGLDFVAKVKDDNSKWKNIPVFVVSNTASPEKIESYMKLGVDKYYTKADNSLEDIINDIEATLI